MFSSFHATHRSFYPLHPGLSFFYLIIITVVDRKWKSKISRFNPGKNFEIRESSENNENNSLIVVIIRFNSHNTFRLLHPPARPR